MNSSEKNKQTFVFPAKICPRGYYLGLNRCQFPVRDVYDLVGENRGSVRGRSGSQHQIVAFYIDHEVIDGQLFRKLPTVV